MPNNLVRRIGFWSALCIALLGAIYLVMLIVFFGTRGFVFPPTPFVQFVGGIVTILTAPAMIVLFIAIQHAAPPEKRILGALGVSFTTLFAACVSINRFVQLTVVRLSPPGPASADLARFLPYSTDSVMFALEILGWGLFLSIAAVCIAPLFGGTRLQLWIRRLLVAFAVFSIMSVIGFSTATPITAGAFVAWGPILLALAILLTLFFRRGEALPAAGEPTPGR